MSEHAFVVQAKYGGQQTLLQTGSNPATMAGTDQQLLTELIVTSALPRPAGLPLVDDWHCLRVRHFCLLQRCNDIDVSHRWPSCVRACDLWCSALPVTLLESVLQCPVSIAFLDPPYGGRLHSWCYYFVNIRSLFSVPDCALLSAGHGESLGGCTRTSGSVRHAAHTHICQPVQHGCAHTASGAGCQSLSQSGTNQAPQTCS